LVLSAWHLTPEFLDKQGRPAILRMTGKRRSFEALLARVGGADVRSTTLLKELLSAGAVRVRADGRLQALKRDYIPQGMDEQLIRLWGTVICDVATTYVHNLTRMKAGKRLERSAVNDRMPVTVVPAFTQMLEKEAQAVLERIDQWLSAHQDETAGNPGAADRTIRLGIGLYQIQD
jgi:hypothetical protein